MNTKKVIINKQGEEHSFLDTNNQDFYMFTKEAKVVIDGCGSLPFSEVGARLYSQLLYNYGSIAPANFEDVTKLIFQKFKKFCQEDDSLLYNNFAFTILACFETEEEFIVFSCGDGYIITKKDNQISFIKLDDGEYPKYYVYNYLQKRDSLEQYKEGVDFDIQVFSKKEYQNVGVATDGLRFYKNLNQVEQNRLFSYLLEGKKAQIGMLINRNRETFKDDITICF